VRVERGSYEMVSREDVSSGKSKFRQTTAT